MNMRGTDAALLLLGLLAYFGYLIVAVFLFRAGYEYGIYLFTPLFLYTLFRVLNARIKRMSFLLAIYLALPFFGSLYLTLSGASPVWEVTGLLPLPVLLSFSFRSEKSSSPLFSTILLPLYGIFFALAFLFALVNYISKGNATTALQLLLSVYSPALVVTTAIVFVRFIIETASLNIILNDFRLFIHGARIRRVVFDSSRFLTFGQMHFSGIVTAEGVSRDLFLKKVNNLNKEFAASAENSDIMRRDAKFSRTLPDGTELTLGTLHLLVTKEGFLTDGLVMPHDLTAKSYVALAESHRVIGYYVIERFDASVNRTMLDVLRDRYGVAAVVIGAGDPAFPGVTTAPTLAEAGPTHDDLLITETPPPEGTPCISALWGKEKSEACDLYLAEPALLNIMKLVILLSTVRSRIQRSAAVTSAPFVLPLFLSIYGLHVPQLNAVAVLLMMLLTITQVFRSVKPE